MVSILSFVKTANCFSKNARVWHLDSNALWKKNFDLLSKHCDVKNVKCSVEKNWGHIHSLTPWKTYNGQLLENTLWLQSRQLERRKKGKHVVTTSVAYLTSSKDYGRLFFHRNPKLTFGLGQTIWADKFWGIWGIFGRFISTHFGTVSPLSMFFQ